MADADAARASQASKLRSDSGYRTYVITARRMTSDSVRKYLEGLRWVILGSYASAAPASASIALTKPSASLTLGNDGRQTTLCVGD